MDDIVLGLIGAVVAVLFFGSNFIPIKKYDTGDGFFFQWVLCVGIWVVGLVVNLARSQPEFQPIAMCGGIIWATGNLLTVPVVNRIGLALGLLIWGSTGLISGWLSGVVGLMGIKKQTDEITSWTLNITGIILALISMGLASLVKPTVKSLDEESPPSALINAAEGDSSDDSMDRYLGAPLLDTQQQKAPTSQRVVGVLLAMFAGVFFGTNFDPPQYVIDRVDGASDNSLDYVFSHYCGILLTSTFWFCVYCSYKERSGAPIVVNPKVILPAMISGIMWGIAQTGFFIANEYLAFVVSFPIVSLGPGFVGFVWGVFLFREITGSRNYWIILVVFLTFIACSVCIVFSRL